MSDGSQSRRTVMGLAWILMTTVFGAPGCAQIPVPRAHSNQVHLPRPTAPPLVATKQTEEAPSQTDEGKALPPLPVPSQGAIEIDTDPPPIPTPLLDEALARANAESVVEPSRLPPDAGDDELSSEAPSQEEPEATNQAAEPPAPTIPPAPTPDSKQVALHTLAGGNPKAGPATVTIDPEKPTKPVEPGVLWEEGLARLRRIASDQSKLDSAGTWSLRSRLLDVLAEEDPRESATPDPSHPTRLALAALGIPYDPGALGGPPRGAEIRAAVLALEGEAPLEVSDLRVCRKVHGFGNYEPLEASACKAGQSLIIYCEMSGLHYSPVGEQFHSRLSSRVELVPANGGEPVWAQALGLAEDVCRHRRRDYYVNYRIVLAETIPPGVYELRLVQKDEVAGRSTAASIPLTIDP